MIKIKDYKEFNGKVFFTVITNGIVIRDCKIANGPNGRFVSGPSRSYTDKQGQTKWFNQVQFNDEMTNGILQALEDMEEDKQDVEVDDVPF